MLYGWIKFHCVYIPDFHYPFFCWLTSRLILFSCVKSSNKHGDTNVSVGRIQSPFDIYLEEAWLGCRSFCCLFVLCWDLYSGFWNGSVRFYSWQQWVRLPLPNIIPSICCFFILGDVHPDWGEVELQSRFNLHFTEGWLCWILLQISMGHLDFFLWQLCFLLIYYRQFCFPRV